MATSIGSSSAGNISFGGLASGMNTSSIIDALMAIERQPLDRLSAQKTTLSNKLDAATKFNTALDTLLDKAKVLSSSDTLLSQTATASSSDYFAVTARSTAVAGDYDVKVGRLAQVEKDVYLGIADRDVTTLGTGTLVLNNDALSAHVNITIDITNDTLQGVRDAINAGSDGHGVTASIVNDGSGTPYRLVLTGKAVTNSNITLDASDLRGGSATFPTKDTDAAVSRSAQTALIQVDGISITSNTNTLTDAIPGVTLDLTHADPAFTPSPSNWSSLLGTTIKVSSDSSGIQKKISDFVAAFNAVVTASKDDNLGGDSGVRAIVASLRSKFTNLSGGTGLFQLGIATQKDGTLLVKSDKLSAAVDNNLAGVEALLAGTAANANGGIADQLATSLGSFTNALTGFLAGRQQNYDTSVRRIDTEIARGEVRVSLKEKQLTDQFSALESLVSSLNTQGNYITQQMNALNGGSK